jgi:hypothetical protein
MELLKIILLYYIKSNIWKFLCNLISCWLIYFEQIIIFYFKQITIFTNNKEVKTSQQ